MTTPKCVMTPRNPPKYVWEWPSVDVQGQNITDPYGCEVEYRALTDKHWKTLPVVLFPSESGDSNFTHIPATVESAYLVRHRIGVRAAEFSKDGTAADVIWSVWSDPVEFRIVGAASVQPTPGKVVFGDGCIH